jgi:hypothetical protein
MTHTDTTTTPVEELRAAAAKLREMAKPASRGPWFVADCELYPRWILSEGYQDERTYAPDVARICSDEADEFVISDADWQWMAFAHPGLAEPLAAWLENVTQAYPALLAAISEGRQEAPERSELGHALAVARVINGGTR